MRLQVRQLWQRRRGPLAALRPRIQGSMLSASVAPRPLGTAARAAPASPWPMWLCGGDSSRGQVLFQLRLESPDRELHLTGLAPLLLQKLQGTQQQFGEIDQPKTLTGFLVMGIASDEGLLVTVAIILNLSRPAAFFFLAVDEPLDLPWRPVTLVEVKLFQSAPDDAVLIV